MSFFLRLTLFTSVMLAALSPNGQYNVSATASALQVSKSGNDATVFDARPLAEEGFALFRKSITSADAIPCHYEREFQPVSLIGKYFTFRDTVNSFCEGAAHPSFATRLTTVDLSIKGAVSYGASEDERLVIPLPKPPEKPTRIISLTELFPPDILLASFKRDPLIKESIASVKYLSDIPSTLPDQGVAVPHQTCQFTLTPDFLTRFRILPGEGPHVAVRIEMSPVGGACHAAAAEIGILLPRPKNEFDLGPSQAETRKFTQEFGHTKTKLEFNVQPQP